jgi:hypothetical protein
MSNKKIFALLVVGMLIAGVVSAQQEKPNLLSANTFGGSLKKSEGVVAPDGSSKSLKIERTRTSNGEDNLRTGKFESKTNGAYTFSVYAKAGSPGAKLYLRFLPAEKPGTAINEVVVAFDLEKGTIAYGGALYKDKIAMAPKDDGWYLCSITGNAAEGTHHLLDIGVTSKSVCGGNEGDFVYFWNARLE